MPRDPNQSVLPSRHWTLEDWKALAESRGDELRECYNENRWKRHEISVLTSQLRVLQNSNSQRAHWLQDAESENYSLRIELDNERTRNKAHETRENQMGIELRVELEKSSALAQAEAALAVRLKEAENREKEAQGRASQAEAELTRREEVESRLNQSLTAAKEHVTQLRETVDSSDRSRDRAIAELKTVKQELVQKNARVMDLEQETQLLGEQLETARTRLAEREDEIKDVRAEIVRDYDKWSTKTANLMDDLRKARSSRIDLDHELSDVRRRLERCETENRTLTQALQQKENSIRELESDNSRLRNNTEHGDLGLDTLRQRLETCETENRTLTQALQQKENSIRELKSDNSRLRNNTEHGDLGLNTLRQRLETCETENRTLTQALQQKENSIRELKSDNSRLRNNTEHGDLGLNTLRQRLETCESEINTLTQAVQQKENSIRELESDNSRLRNKTEREAGAHEEMLRQVREANEARTCAENSTRNIMCEYNYWCSQVRTYEREAETEKAALKARVELLIWQIQEFEKLAEQQIRIRELGIEEKAREALAEKERSLTEVRLALRERDRELDCVRTALNGIRVTLNAK